MPTNVGLQNSCVYWVVYFRSMESWLSGLSSYQLLLMGSAEEGTETESVIQLCWPGSCDVPKLCCTGGRWSGGGMILTGKMKYLESNVLQWDSVPHIFHKDWCGIESRPMQLEAGDWVTAWATGWPHHQAGHGPGYVVIPSLSIWQIVWNVMKHICCAFCCKDAQHQLSGVLNSETWCLGQRGMI